jgi:deoxyribodipyrimidine photo-lyase
MSPMQQPILWIHGEALGPANPALQAHPGQPAVFVFDEALIREQAISLKRLGFLYECLLELPVSIRKGDVAEQVLAFAREHQADGVITSTAVDPRFEIIRSAIAHALPITVLTPEPFVELDTPANLQRFSRYWRQAEPLVWEAY